MKRIAGGMLAALVCAVAPALAGHTQVPIVRLETQAEVAAQPAVVWAYMTSGKNMVTWCPEWKNAKNTTVTIAKVGDVLDFSDAWGNNGRSVVTYLAKDKELRVAHEPNDGSYVCQAKLLLAPTAKGTMVRYIEHYTDESAPKDLEATAVKTETEMKATLAALKKGVERR